MKILPGSLLCFFLLPCAAWAQVTLLVDPATPVPSSVTAGNSFSVNLDLNNQTSTGVAGYDVDIESLVFNPSTSTYMPVSNDFSLTDVTLTSPALNFPNSNLPTPDAPVVLDPQAGSASQPLDIGASNLFTSETLGTGVSPLETVALQVAATAAPGTYELEFFAINGNAQGPVTISDDSGNSIGTSSTPFYSNSFTVASAPEPPVVWLFAAALTLFFSVKAVWKRNGLARG